MAISFWTVSYQASGGLWVTDGNLPRPNANLNYETISTQTKVQLSDGSNAYITPEVKYLKSPMIFSWYFDDGTYKTKIENYMKNNEYLKITTHLGVDLIGKFIGLKASHLVGESPDSYDLEAIFEVHEG